MWIPYTCPSAGLLFILYKDASCKLAVLFVRASEGINVRSGPGRAVRPCGVTLPSSLARLSLSHKNMTTIYQTAVPSGSSEPNSDFDAIQPVSDVYEAYQRALADEEVSPNSSDIIFLNQGSRYLPL